MSNFAFLHSYDLLGRRSVLMLNVISRQIPTRQLSSFEFSPRELLRRSPHSRLSIFPPRQNLLTSCNTQASRVIERHVLDSFHFVRITGNKAAHEHSQLKKMHSSRLRSAHSVCGWFYVNHVNRDHELQEFVTPGLLDHDVPLASAARKAIVLALVLNLRRRNPSGLRRKAETQFSSNPNRAIG